VSSSQGGATREAFDHILNAFRGVQTVQAAALGLELGLLHALRDAGEQTSAELAERLELHPPYVRVWCEAGYAFGLLEIAEDGKYRLAPGMETVLLDADHPRWLGGFARGFVSFLDDDFRRYPDAFRTGAVFPFGEHGAAFSAWVASLTHPMQRLVVGRVLPEHFGDALAEGIRVLDIGCGAGQLIFKLADAFPRCQFVGIDGDAHGIALAGASAAERGLTDRVQFHHLKGEMSAFENTFDLALMFEVLHEIPLEDRPAVMQSAFRALRSGGHLFILDETLPDDPRDLRDPAWAMSILVQFSELIWGNVVSTEQAQTALLTQAGFTDIQRGDLGGVFTLITARKP
jgi:SAM-dependent methyltransferase